jgi:hypothetical protein
MTTKTETPKTETPKTETSNPFAGAFPNPFAGAFDPMAAFTASQQAFHQMMAEGLQRMASFAEEYAALESQMIARAQGAVANMAQLAQDAIAYSAQLSAQARKLGLETARKMGAGA